MKTTLQVLVNESDDKFLLAQRYYSLLSTLNDLRLTERETQLIAFAAVRGNISYATIREDFCARYKTSFPTINNMISRLKKIGVFIKEGGKIKVNPRILLPFDNDIKMLITLKHKNGEATNTIS